MTQIYYHFEKIVRYLMARFLFNVQGKESITSKVWYFTIFNLFLIRFADQSTAQNRREMSPPTIEPNIFGDFFCSGLQHSLYHPSCLWRHSESIIYWMRKPLLRLCFSKLSVISYTVSPAGLEVPPTWAQVGVGGRKNWGAHPILQSAVCWYGRIGCAPEFFHRGAAV